MDIKVLGSGCHNCLRLELLVGQILGELGIEANLSRTDDPRQIDRYALTNYRAYSSTASWLRKDGCPPRKRTMPGSRRP